MPKLTKSQAVKRLQEAVNKLGIVSAYGGQYMTTQQANKLFKCKGEIFAIMNRLKGH
jgi:hypothetical protein